MRAFFSLVCVVAGFLSSSTVFAAGYSCLSVDQDAQVVVTLETAQAEAAKHITFIDPTLSERAKVIAAISAENLTHEPLQNGLRFIADAKVAASGKRLGGTRASLLDHIIVDIQTVSKAMKTQEFVEGSVYAGQVTYVKKDGQTLTQDFDCALFLGEDAPVAPPGT